MTLNPQQIRRTLEMTRKPLLLLESPSLLRMYLKNKITFDQAYGIEEFFRWKNQAVYEPHVKRKLQMIADFMRVRRAISSRDRASEIMLWHFVGSDTPQTWSPYDSIHKKRKGWMKDTILFMGRQLDHVVNYFGEGEGT